MEFNKSVGCILANPSSCIKSAEEKKNDWKSMLIYSSSQFDSMSNSPLVLLAGIRTVSNLENYAPIKKTVSPSYDTGERCRAEEQYSGLCKPNRKNNKVLRHSTKLPWFCRRHARMPMTSMSTLH